MKKIYALFVIVALGLASCTPSRESQIATIKELEVKVNQSIKGAFDEESAKELIEDYTQFIDGFGQDTLSKTYMFKGGQLASSINLPREAVSFLKPYVEKYLDDVNTPEAIMLLGTVYENQLYMINDAEVLYKEFLAKYPTHQYAEIVKTSLANIGRTPEEILGNTDSTSTK